LVLACLGLADAAEADFVAAEEMTRSVEVQTLVPVGRAIAVDRSAGAGLGIDAASIALKNALERGGADSFICGYRAYPALLRRVASTEATQLRPILRRARDARLAAKYGIAQAPVDTSRSHGLTPREAEVYELLAEGLTNHEIAQRLFISEVTAKVHVRRILEKLGVRTRTQAAVLAAGERDY
jgi:DNA-binding NarL/FixJ family response regulator